MISKLIKKISSKRASNMFFWRIAFFAKDKILNFISITPLYLKDFLLLTRYITLHSMENLFFKRRHDHKLKIKIISSFIKEASHINYFSRFCKKDNSWNNLVLSDGLFADYYIILNHPYCGKFHYFNPKKTIIFQCEPISTRNTWGKWREPQKESFFYVFNTKDHHNYIEWHLEKNYQWLMNEKIQKYKNISSITSAYYILPGHKKRLDFLQILDKEVIIDVFGKPNFGDSEAKSAKLTNLSNYKGKLPNNCKDDGLFPYKYTFAAENSSEKNYFTEKIVDAILSECLCFYWGCPNLGEFIDERAFIRIDLDNPQASIYIIKEAMENNEWEKRLPYIKQAKQKILNELQFMPTIEKIIETKKA